MFLCNRGIAPARGRNDTEGKGTGQKANGAVVTTAYSGSKFAAA
ncbi:MAG: hypothetical protein U0L72_07795 [Acutalibacteraceae bacterium]|nr:hypothetical protein [Acutalibacteraceae bacterium]